MPSSSSGDLLRLLKMKPRCVLLLILLCSLSALVEGFGIGLILPLVDSSPNQEALQQIPGLARLGPWFSQITPTERLQMVACGLALVAIVRGVLVFLRSFFTRYFETDLAVHLQRLAYQQYNRLELSYIHAHDLSTFSNLITSYPAESAAIAGQSTLAMAILLNFSVYGLFLLSLSWRLTLGVGLFLLLLSSLTHYLLHKRIQGAAKKVNQAAINLNQWFFESARSLSFIRGIGRQEQANKRFSRLLNTYRASSLSQAFFQTIVDPLLTTLVLFMLGVSLYLGAPFLTGDASGLAQVILFLVILSRLLPMLTMLNEVRGAIASKAPLLRHLFEFLEVQTQRPLEKDLEALRLFEGELCLSQVSFTYPGRLESALANIDFTLPAKSMTALVGPSGSGKSTLMRLILRLYEPDQGAISLNGENIQKYSLESWGKHVAYVPQEPLLFDDTVKNNLLFVKEEATEVEIVDACKLAHAHGFIQALPQGYETRIGDNGVKLSGGQKQRLAIARALLSQPRLLVLDEATSNLDSASEAIIQDAIKVLNGRVTLLVIAHRLASIVDADQIMVLDKGKVVERGTHQALLQNKGPYSKLVHLQQLEPASCDKAILAVH